MRARRCCGNYFGLEIWREPLSSRRADTAMPVCESEAIILRSFPLGEGDLLISFFSRTHGRSRGVASGARRPKSRFGSTLEPLSYIRIWFYERETRPLARINQTELIESFLAVQSDYVAGAALALVSDITEAVLGNKRLPKRTSAWCSPPRVR